MTVTSTDFKTNLGKYLDLVESEDIVITRNGRSVAKLTSSKKSRLEIARSLFGIIPDDGTTLEQAREERLARYENID